MKFSNYLKYMFVTTFIFFSSCETVDLDQLEDPSALSAKFLDPIYSFNYVQLQLPDFVDSANSFTQRVTRQMAMTGGNTYDNAFAPVNSNRNWSTAYKTLYAIKAMEPLALEKKQYYLLGASKVIRCYILLTLVDLYGDIPFTEAILGNDNLTPNYDKSDLVYKNILLELDKSIEFLNTSGSKEGSDFIDLYYGSSLKNKGWVNLANTLKLKMFTTARLAASDIGITNLSVEINNIVSSGNYINTPDKDFAFQYGSNRSTPNSRHPLYNDQYELGGGAYISNYFMWAVTKEKKNPIEPTVDIVDPRAGFYFCKQYDDPSDKDKFTLPYTLRPSHYNSPEFDSFYVGSTLCPYVVSNWVTNRTSPPANGYWGRDHGDNSGIPPDADFRTVAGVYPVGGKYDTGLKADHKSVQNSGVEGALGAGIMPIVLSSYAHFMLAECILTVPGVIGNAKTELTTAITQSIDKTISKINDYPKIKTDDRPYPNSPEGTYEPGTLVTNIPTLGAFNTIKTENYSTFGKISIRDKNKYIDFVSLAFDDYNDSKKLELVIKEYYIASWGNGIEPYNNYRRTGYPSNFQPTIEPISGDYYYTALYSAEAINNNPNAPFNSRTRKVFWDKANLILH